MALSLSLLFAPYGIAPALAQVDPHDDSGPPPAVERPKRRIAVIGDSHVEALGPLLTETAKKRGDELRFESHRGSFTREWAENGTWGEWIGEFKPKLVVIILGTNDALVPHPDTHRPHFVSLALRLRKAAPGAIVVWIEPPQLPRLKRLALVRENIRALSNVIIVRNDDLMLEIREDKIHPTAKGYRAWADEIASHI